MWAEALNEHSIEGLIEAYASYDTVGLEIDPTQFNESLLFTFEIPTPISFAQRKHEIPVCYGLGSDMEIVCDRLGVSSTEFEAIHSSSTYRCEAVGFCPGFPYLSGLDSRLQNVPRRPSPRTSIEPGAIAITGAQCGIYPMQRPGGWAIVGRTPLTIVDPGDRYFPISAGDLIEFLPIDPSEFEKLVGERL